MAIELGWSQLFQWDAPATRRKAEDLARLEANRGVRNRHRARRRYGTLQRSSGANSERDCGAAACQRNNPKPRKG
eukprot:15466421-Alexandrium_andersonii.AAC.1